MSRSLFDPQKAAGAEPLKDNGQRQERLAAAPQLRVSQVVELIKTTLETRIPSPLRVVGQVSNLRSNNHWYFSLKDDHAVLHCVAWATAARKFGFVPKDGDEVVATGHLSHYGPQGKTQLYVDALQPVGAGALELKFRALCEELRALGYFTEERKKKLPLFPRRVAVITSRTGAALTDVIATACQRCKAIRLLIVDVRVQGDGAAEDVARAIKWVDSNRGRLSVDAMLVTRGGGSIEDLWAFNERIVADAVFNCRLPVVAAIGHESDSTIIELVADVRASTPTQAVMRLIPSTQELCGQIEHLAHRLGSLLRRAVEQQRQKSGRVAGDLVRIIRHRVIHDRARLEQMTRRLAHARPTAQLSQRQARLAVLNDRMHRAIVQRLQVRQRLAIIDQRLHRSAAGHLSRLREGLLAREHRLNAIDPHGVLRRGYSITQKADGSIVKSVGDVRSMERITTRVSDGAIESIVKGGLAQPAVTRRAGTSRAKPQTAAIPTPGAGLPAGAEASDQLDLFGASR